MLKSILVTVFAFSILLEAAQADNTSDWNPLSGQQIQKVLAGASLVYPDEGGATQDFESNGSTVWVQGAPSFGEWKVSDTQYCSVWPPSAAWVCYDVSINEQGTAVRFVGDSGKIYEGIFK